MIDRVSKTEAESLADAVLVFAELDVISEHQGRPRYRASGSGVIDAFPDSPTWLTGLEA